MTPNRRVTMASHIERRKFLATLGGAAAAWPLVARAQQPERMRRIGVLMNLTPDDPEGHTRVAAFLQGLQQLGWVDGVNLRVDTRWGSGGGAESFRRYAAELVALEPEVILASGFPSTAALQQVTGSLPVVFVLVLDPVGAGFIESLAHPGGNFTGFAQHEFNTSGKWLELLKQITPHVTRVGVLRDAALTAGTASFA